MLAAALAASLTLLGCSSKQEKVDPAPLQNSFQTADPATKSTADKAVTAIKSGDYASAMAELKTLAADAKLTPEQQQAIKDVMAQVQQALAETAAKVQGEASKAIGDVQKSLPK